MTKSFLEFFELIQTRQTDIVGPIDTTNGVRVPSNAVRIAAPAAPISKPSDEAGRGMRTDTSEDVAWSEVSQAARRVGPLLSSLRAEQDHQPFSRRESYSLEHVKRLDMFKPNTQYRKPRANRLCSKTHQQPCSYSCKTCHFCRQRTTEIKTVCSLCEGVNNYYGGPARGYWCGSCLWLRVGENIDEVRNREDWVCPACRDLCNCSGANCMRIKRGWFPTNQLAHEARDQGFRSVAHYLVLTHVSEATSAAPIADNSHLARPVTRQLPEPVVDGPPTKRQKTLDFSGYRTREQALQRASQARLQSALTVVMEELGIGNRPVGGRESVLQQLLDVAVDTGAQSAPRALSPFLGILDSDMMDDADKEEETHETEQRHGSGAEASRRDEENGSCSLATTTPPAIRPSTAPLSFDGLPPRSYSRAHYRAPATVSAAAAAGAQQGRGILHSAAAETETAPDGTDGNARLLRFLAPITDDTGGHAGLHTAGEDSPPRRRASVLTHSELPLNARITRCGPSSSSHHSAHPPGKQSVCATPHAAHSRWQLETGTPSETREGMHGDVEAPIHLQRAPELPCTVGHEDGGLASSGAQVSAPNSTEHQHREGAGTEIIFERRGDPGFAAEEEEQHRDGRGSGGVGAQLETATSCTFAYTASAAKASCYEIDTVVWNGLCLRARTIVQTVNALYRHHPEAPEYQGLLLATQEDDIAAYEAAYDASIQQLRDVLHGAEALNRDEVAICACPDSALNESSGTDDTTHHQGTLHSHAALRCAVALLTYLARLLPENDVIWGVERLLLGIEPFVSFERSDVRARAILFTGGYLELLATMHRRGLDAFNASVAVANAIATTANDMVSALPLLNAILSNEPMPTEDIRIGAWCYDNPARGRRLIDIFSELSELYASMMKLLVFGLQRATALCRVLGTNSSAFLNPVLVDALFAPDRKLPRDVKREALSLVCAVLTASSPKDVSNAELDLTANERAKREGIRARLCEVLENGLIPALETLVQQDYPMWGDQQQSWESGGRATPSTVGGGNTGNADVAPAEHIGGEKVEALARCYAFMVCCRKLSWSSVEAKATQPFSFSLFWRQANTAYRHFAVFLLAHTLDHAPCALQAQAHASSVMRLWMQSINDTGRRHCVWYLTKVLAEHPSTAPLFAGLQAPDLDIRGDVSGEIRAALVAKVGNNLMLSNVWRSQLSSVVGELDVLLAARRKEIEATTFNPVAATMQWERSAGRVLLALLRSVSAAMAPPSGRNLPRDLAASQLRNLLTRFSGWALGSCAAVHVAHRRGVSNLHADIFECAVISENEDTQAHQLSTVGDARQRMQSTAFAAVSALFDILRSVGAPAVFDVDPELLEPLWVIVAGCLDLGSGEITPTPVDVAMFELLASALAPSSPACEQGMGFVELNERFDSARVSIPPPHHELCTYVLSTVVRRALVRSSLRHASHERAAVNALRLVMGILEQPSMRSSEPLMAALATLLWPMLSVLNPDGGAPSSAGTKAVLFQLLSNLVSRSPTVLPPLNLPPNAGGQRMTAALHALWLAVCRDVLRCIYDRLQADTAAQKIALAESKTAGAHPTPLWPSTDQTVAEARNAMLSNLGRPCDMTAVERLATRPGSLPAMPLELSSSASSFFRPGDFPWKLADAGICLLRTLAMLRTEIGVQTDAEASPLASPQHLSLSFGANWSMACFPATHYLIVGAAQSTKLLHLSYKRLRSELESALGEECMSPYGLAKQAPLPAASVVVGVPSRSTATDAQEQRQPNAIVSSPAPEKHQITRFISISSLYGLTVSTKVSLTAFLTSIRSRSYSGGEVLICTLKDYSGPGNSSVGASLVASAASIDVVGGLKQVDVSRGPREVKLMNLELARVSSKPDELCVVKAIAASRIVIGDPEGSVQAPLQLNTVRSSHSDARVTIKQEIGSQPTQPAIMASPPRIKAEYEMVARKTLNTGENNHNNNPTDLLHAVHRRLREMGYSDGPALEAIRDVRYASGGGSDWLKQATVEQLLDAAVQRLE